MAKLGISDLIKTIPKTADDLARATNSDANSLRRLLLFLASQGIYAADAEDQFRQTPLSDTLRTDHPQSVRSVAVEHAGPEFWNIWGDLEQTVVTGQPAFERMHGMSFFEQRMGKPDEAAGLSAGMSRNSSGSLAGILAAYDFSRFKTIVDVGGGQGTLLSGILDAHPGVQGTLADLPEVFRAAGVVRTPAMADRCRIIGMDFFSDQLVGADAYILKNIIHDWDDEKALKILRNCRRGIHADGRLLIIDYVLGPPNVSDPARWSDMEMMTLLHGRERSESEFCALLQSAGFALLKVIPTSDSGMSIPIIESRPA